MNGLRQGDTATLIVTHYQVCESFKSVNAVIILFTLVLMITHTETSGENPNRALLLTPET